MIGLTTQVRRLYVHTGATGNSTGFTLIELMIVMAVIAVLLTMALPVYSIFSIRAKLGEALSVTAAAKSAVVSTCQEDPLLTGLTNNKVGYTYRPSKWVQSITVSGDCSEPMITVSTQNTGAPGDVDILLTGDFKRSGKVFTWTCSSAAENRLLPAECRSAD